VADILVLHTFIGCIVYRGARIASFGIRIRFVSATNYPYPYPYIFTNRYPYPIRIRYDSVFMYLRA